MTKKIAFSGQAGPFCKLSNHNLVLQEMDSENERKGPMQEDAELEKYNVMGIYPPSEATIPREEEEGRSEMSGLDDLVGAEELKAELEMRGPEFRHTAEYYELIKDEKERMKAYSKLEVAANIPEGEDAEIAKEPFKFLYLPDDANFGQVRAAQITLSKMWHPDLVNPKDTEQLNRLFGYGTDFPIDNLSWEGFIDDIVQCAPPQTLSVEELERLSPEERKSYRIAKQEYLEKELVYEEVKKEMVARATKKMTIINKAYAEALKRFSNSEKKSFAGYQWEGGTITSEALDFFFASILQNDQIPYMFRPRYEKLGLEGEGEIRRFIGKEAYCNVPCLVFDHGDIYLGNDDYRQSLDLRTFFAWMEMRQQKELCPSLLDGIQEAYKLTNNQAEQLRLMLMNHEEPYFIFKTLGIGEGNNGCNQANMWWFIDEIYNGPTFGIDDGPRRECHNYPLGVELTQKGELELTFMAQEDSYWMFTNKAHAHFSKADMELMQSIAYGPLLVGMN